MKENLRIALVRRGYSPTGGAEAYLKRLAGGVIEAGQEAQLIATNKWPEGQLPFGSITRLRTGSIIGFADELEQIRPQLNCDVLFSLERVWSCDVYRAGDGVHRAWLRRRTKFELPLKQFGRALNRTHRDLLKLEESLLGDRKAARVIVASQMVKNEIADFYGYPADSIDIVRNGVPLDKFRFDSAFREKSREDLKLKPDQIVLLFAGSGWQRKGLLFAIEAMALCKNRKMRLLVAGLEAHWSLEGLTSLVYGVPKALAGLPADAEPTPELKAAQRAFFALLYRLRGTARDKGRRRRRSGEHQKRVESVDGAHEDASGLGV